MVSKRNLPRYQRGEDNKSMPNDPTPAPTPAPEPKPGTDPKNPGTPPANPFDPTKLGDEDLNKVLEDPRLWKLPRIAELRKAQKDLKVIQDQQSEEEKKRLAEQGQFKELSEKTAQERDEAVKRANALELKIKVNAAASKKGVTDLELLEKLVDYNSIKTDENGNTTGIDEAIDAVITARPFLVGTAPPPKVGDPTNPGNPSNPPGTFTMTQIGDPKFYQEHSAEILKAQVEGKIIDDRAPAK